MIFLNLWSAHEEPTYQAFSPFQFVSNAIDHRMVSVQFFSNLLWGCKKISFSDALSWSLSTFDGQPLHSSSSSFLSPLQNFLNHLCIERPLEFPGPSVLLMLWVVSSALQPILNSNKKIVLICLNWLFV